MRPKPLLVVFLSLNLVAVAHAEAPDRPSWLDRPYKYVVIDEPVRDALIDLGRDVQIPVVTGDEVQAKIRDQIAAGTVEDFLHKLSLSAQLTWYFDGDALHVDNQSSIRTEVINVREIGAASVAAILPKIATPGDGAFITLDGTSLRVSGPPAFITLVRQYLETIRPAPPPREVRVFRGGTLEVVTNLPGSDHETSHAKTHGSIVAIKSMHN